MGRNPCCKKEGLNRGAWTAIEDKLLTDYVKAHGEGKWKNIPKAADLKRCGKSCRLRWLNYLRPNIKRGNISPDEEDLIIRLHKLLGNRWSLIAGRLPGRTDNEIKNYWNTNLSKRTKGNQANHSKSTKKSITRAPQESHDQLQQHKVENHETNAADEINTMGTESESYDVSISIASREENSSEFMADFNLSEISGSEILGLDFPNLGNFDMENVMAESWSSYGFGQVNCLVDPDFGSLGSFLGSNEQWMV